MNRCFIETSPANKLRATPENPLKWVKTGKTFGGQRKAGIIRSLINVAIIQSTFSGLDRLARNSFAGGVGRSREILDDPLLFAST